MNPSNISNVDLAGVAITATLSSDGVLGPVDGLARKIAARGVHTVIVSDQQPDLDELNLVPDPTQPNWRVDPTRDFRLMTAATLDDAIKLLDGNMHRWAHIDCDIDGPTPDFIPRPGLDRLIDDFAANHGGHYLVLVGGMGRGKSTFIAERLRRLRENHDDPPVYHIIRGRESTTADPKNIAACLFDRLRRKYCDFRVPAEWGPKDPANARVLLEKLLKELSKTVFEPRGWPEVIYLEAADQTNLPPHEVLLPGTLQRQLPPGVVVVITTRQNQAWRDQGERIVVEEFDDHTKDREDIKQYILKRNPRLSTPLPNDIIDSIVRQQTLPVFFTVRKVLDDLERANAPEPSGADPRSDVAPWLAAPEDKVSEEYDRLIRACRQAGVSPDCVGEILGTLVLLKQPLSKKQLNDLGLWSDDMSTVIEHAASFFKHRHDRHRVDLPLEWDHPGYERAVLDRLMNVRQIQHRIAEGCHRAWSDRDSSAHQYSLSHAVSHLIKARDWERLFGLLTNWRFLEARASAGQVFDLVTDLDRAAATLADAKLQGKSLPANVCPPLIRLLAAAVRSQAHAVARRDQPRDRANLLFQCCWNAGYWHDSDEAAAHYDTEGFTGSFPWDQPKEHRISTLVQAWRDEKTTEQGKFVWLRSHRPLPEPLLGPKVFRGHESRVNSVAFSPDGTRIASASQDCTIRIWDVATGEPVGQPLSEHRDPVRRVSFSPDGTRLVSGCEGGVVCLWAASTLTLIASRIEHGRFRSLELGNKRVLYRSNDQVIIDEHSYALTQLHWNPSAISHYAFSSDDNLIASGGWDGSIQLWSVTTGLPIGRPMLGHTGEVTSLQFSSDGKILLSGSSDRTVMMWNVETGEPADSRIALHSTVRSAYFVAEDVFEVASSDRTIRYFNNESMDQVGETEQGDPLFLVDNYSVLDVAFSPDGRWISSSSTDGTTCLYDGLTLNRVGNRLRHDHTVYCTAFSADSKLLFTGTCDGIGVWSIALGTLTATLEHDIQNGWHRISCSPTRIALGGDYAREIQFWNLDTHQRLQKLSVEHRDLIFSPDGQWIYAACEGFVGKWAVETRELNAKFAAPQTSCIAYSSKGDLLACGSDDHAIRVWDLKDTSTVLTGRQHHVSDFCLALSLDGRRIATASYRGEMLIWDATNGLTLLPPLEGCLSRVSCVAFSPDGLRVAAIGCDERDETCIAIWIWDALTGKLLCDPLMDQIKPGPTVRSNPSPMWVSFSSDGKRLVGLFRSDADDPVIQLWSTVDYTPIGMRLRDWTGASRRVTFSSDDKNIVLHLRNGKYYSFEWEECIRRELSLQANGLSRGEGATIGGEFADNVGKSGPIEVRTTGVEAIYQNARTYIACWPVCLQDVSSAGRFWAARCYNDLVLLSLEGDVQGQTN